MMAGLFLQWPIEGPDDILVGNPRPRIVFTDSAPVYRHRIGVDQVMLDEFAHDGGNAAGMIIVLAKIFPGRL
jgi:hypothetical protein